VIFIDTGAFLGKYFARDQHHRKAVRAWKSLADKRQPCFTSNFVLDEFFTLLGRRAGGAFAAERARRVYASRAFTILRPEEEDEHQAVDLLAKFADQEVSFTDCISFVLMRRRGLQRVFGFDRHFRAAGFQTFP